MSTDDQRDPKLLRTPEEFFRVDRPDPRPGAPELRWRGKRPFQGVHFSPARHRERHGEPTGAWMNELYWGDNLEVMGHLLRRHRGGFRLIYLDPPFDSKAQYKKRIELRGRAVATGPAGFEEEQYGDVWSHDEYLPFVRDRLALLRELLAPDGALWLQSDHRRSHHLRCLLEEVFGAGAYLNTISWRSQVARGAKVNAYYFPASTQTIHIFGKGRHTARFNVVRKQVEISGEEAGRDYLRDEGGYFRTSDPGSYSYDSLKRLHAEGRIYAPKGGCPLFDDDTRTVVASKGGSIGIKYYLRAGTGGRWYATRAVDNIWDDVPGLGTTPGESVDYPTQKPEALLRRIIEVSTDPGDLVFDGFMGSGTTQAVAMKLGRRFVGADINLGSVQTTTRRLLRVAEGLRRAPSHPREGEALPLYTGFDVYTVNQHDVFRNELEARAVLMEALAIRPLPGADAWHGERGEGSERRLVRFMPTQRVATTADLDAVLGHLDWKLLARRQAETPGEPVLRATLVCMGHEPGLADRFAQDVRAGLGDAGAKVDVEVVDLVRDANPLAVKRQGHAQVRVSGGRVIIERFCPSNLLRRLSLDEAEVEDWRELVESVFVDFRFDGSVLRPAITDVAQGRRLVKGVYDVPPGAGVIRVQITDLLSDVLEVDAEAG